MDEDILHYYNPWWSGEYTGPGILRSRYLESIKQALNLQKAVFIYGLRRVGKTYILKQFITAETKRLGATRVFYVSLDHPDLSSASLMELLDVFRRMNKVRREEPQLLVLDEVQHRQGFELELKTLVDIEDGLKIVASGSNSLVIRHKSSAMTGRYKKIQVNPLDFLEYLGFVGESFDRTQPQLMASFMDDFLVTGGIPHYVLNRDPEFIVDLIDDIIYKDIATEYEIRNPVLLKDLYYLLMDRIAKPMTFSKIGRLVGLGNDAARKYVGYLEETYLLRLVERYGSPNTRKFSPRKCYCPDNSLRTVMVGNRGKGALAENLVFNILDRQGGEIHYFQQEDREIDFVFGNTALEVKFKDKLDADDVKPLKELKARGITKKVIISSTAKPLGRIKTLPLWRFAAGEKK